MFEDYYMTVDEVARALKISKSFALQHVRTPSIMLLSLSLVWCVILKYG